MKKLILLAVVVLFLLNGCVSVWHGTLSSNLYLTPEQYNLVWQASGTAKTFILFGFLGGNDHSNLVNEAKGDLIRNNPLDSNMYYGDWSVSFQTRYHLFGIEQFCQVTAGIFSLHKTSKPYERKFSRLENLAPFPIEKAKPLSKGDKVEFIEAGETRKGEITKFEGNTITIRYYEGKHGYLKTVNKLISEVKRIQ